MRRIAPFAVLLLVLAGCGGSGGPRRPSSTAPPAPTAPATGATTTNAAPAPATTSLAVYFVRDGKVAPVRRNVPETKAVGAAALAQLLAGPSAEERAAGLASAVPSGTSLSGLKIAGGDARLAGVDALGRKTLGQVVYTLTQFPSVQSVDGHTRAELEDVTPIVLVESPLPGDAVTSPLHVRGTANTFEANVQLSLSDSQGPLVDTFTTATSGNGTRGTFDGVISFTTRHAGAGTLLAYDVNQASGVREHVFTVPVVFR
jgi:Immunoglobulin-like domain of bacterial spore germination/Sporulation and spore germination